MEEREGQGGGHKRSRIKERRDEKTGGGGEVEQREREAEEEVTGPVRM